MIQPLATDSAETSVGFRLVIPNTKIHIRLMTKTDIPAGMRLKDLAGWNQTPEDWLRFLVASLMAAL